MSSIQEKDQSPRKRILLRKMSFDKIKCSAAPLLGSIFSKDSPFIHLLENAMNSSRAVVQKPAIVLVIPAIHILCVAMAVFVALIKKLTGGVSFEKLDIFIAKINHLKSKIQSFSVQTLIKERINNTLNKQTSFEHEENQKQIECKGLIDESSVDCIKVQDETKKKSCDKHRLLQVSTFACIGFVYTEFFFLVFLLTQSQFRDGVFFLLFCISTISFFATKISFIKYSREEKRVSRKQIMTNRTLIAMNPSRPTNSDFTHIRSRSKATENCLQKEKLL